MTSIHYAPSRQKEGIEPEHGRREFLKNLSASALAIGATVAATRAGCKYAEAERADIYQLVKNFPSDLNGIHRVETFPEPGAKQCILRFVHMHPQAQSASALADVQPDIIRSWQNCGDNIANAIADLQQRYPQYAMRGVFCEGVQSSDASDKSDLQSEQHITRIRTIWGHGVSSKELWNAACNEHNDVAYEFLVRCGAVAQPVLRGELKVQGITSEDLDSRIAPLMDRYNQGTISSPESQALKQLLEKYEEHVLDQIQKSGERFPILPIGDGHDMVAAAKRWHSKHPDSSPFSIVNIWPEETAKRWNEQLMANRLPAPSLKFHQAP